jgi:Amt family ammonium transporter
VIVNSSGADGLIYGNGIQILRQLTSVAAIGGYSFGVSWGLARLLKATMGLRVNATEETVGLDISQHGERAYGGVLR